MPQNRYTVEYEGKRYVVEGDHPPTAEDMPAIVAQQPPAPSVAPARLGQFSTRTQYDDPTQKPTFGEYWSRKASEAAQSPTLQSMAQPRTLADIGRLLLPVGIEHATAGLTPLSQLAGRGRLQTAGDVASLAGPKGRLFGRMLQWMGKSSDTPTPLTLDQIKTMQRLEALEGPLATGRNPLLIKSPAEWAGNDQVIKALQPSSRFWGHFNAAKAPRARWPE